MESVLNKFICAFSDFASISNVWTVDEGGDDDSLSTSDDDDKSIPSIFGESDDEEHNNSWDIAVDDEDDHDDDVSNNFTLTTSGHEMTRFVFNTCQFKDLHSDSTYPLP